MNDRRAQHKDHVWSYDFVTDRTEDRRQIQLLVVIDEFTRECLAIEVARSISARQVVEVLRYLFADSSLDYQIPAAFAARCTSAGAYGLTPDEQRPHAP
jgi:hypothetical protein